MPHSKMRALAGSGRQAPARGDRSILGDTDTGAESAHEVVLVPVRPAGQLGNITEIQDVLGQCFGIRFHRNISR